ncbi:lisH domain-containing protein FOPNL [Chelonus insularis]|uniref:lisH domain-containing protein FOPNL n=1 Tax=Chelonus insularis TaxID=460826 RepID=UPI00158C8BEB|nr:lisH domain-containing protein FOPNL [Chelonus insularis]
MSTESDLINAVRDSLETDGELRRIKAEVRKKIMNLLDSSPSNRIKHSNLSHNVLLVNELIREYLDWIGYKYTLSVLTSESDLKNHPLDRTTLSEALGIDDGEKTKQLPLLFCVIQTLKNLKTTSKTTTNSNNYII